MPKKLNVTELDFDQIRSNLKTYFTRKDSPFQDWDFEGSGLSNLLDVLAYNTHYNAMLAHMTLNEGFIDTAQLRESVVSHAKLLGYTPASKKSPRVKINVVFTASSAKSTTKLTVARGAKFSATLNGETYIFVVAESKTVNRVNGQYNFTYVSPTVDNSLEIAQGSLNRVSFLVDSNLPSQRFVITDQDVDTTTLKVYVRENAASTSIEKFNIFTSLSETTSTSPVYFISENYQGNFELTFGDGVYGKKLDNLQVVEVEYVSTLGAIANGSASFTFISGVLNSEAITGSPTITLLQDENGNNLIASGGGDRETIENIRFTAPISFVAQNRAVTANDYIAIIQREYGAVDAINVWGGEDQDPITPSGAGRVYISIKPQGIDEVLSPSEKEKILAILEPKRVITLKTNFVDPDYTYLYFDVSFKYDESKSSLTLKELETAVNDAVDSYNNEYLQKFNGVFRYSKFLNYLDSVNVAIANTDARVQFYKIYNQFANTTLDIDTYITNKTFTPSGGNTIITVTLSEDFDLLSSWYVNFYNSTTPVYENYPITVLSDYVFTFTVSGSVSSLTYTKAVICRASSTYPGKIDFSNGLYGRQDDDSQQNLLTSSTWSLKYNTSSKLPSQSASGTTTKNVHIVDEPIIDIEGSGTYNTRLLALYDDSTVPVRLFTVGSVDLESGIVYLNQPIVNILDITSKPTIYAIPDSNDIAPKRNQLLTIDTLKTTVSGEVDTILSGGSAGSINYNTFKK
jgi:hypothetical protein